MTVCIADRYPSTERLYRDADQWLESLCGALAIELQRGGAAGAHIIDASVIKQKDGVLDALLTVGPGQESLTAERVRNFIALQEVQRRGQRQDADLHRRAGA